MCVILCSFIGAHQTRRTWPICLNGDAPSNLQLCQKNAWNRIIQSKQFQFQITLHTQSVIMFIIGCIKIGWGTIDMCKPKFHRYLFCIAWRMSFHYTSSILLSLIEFDYIFEMHSFDICKPSTLIVFFKWIELNKKLN